MATPSGLLLLVARGVCVLVPGGCLTEENREKQPRSGKQDGAQQLPTVRLAIRKNSRLIPSLATLATPAQWTG